MKRSSNHHKISDDLLTTLINIRREAGVTQAQIQDVISQYASAALWEERTGGIGFPLVEDVPEDRRAAFLAAISDLAPNTDAAASAKPRYLSVHDVWPSRF